MQAFIGIYPDVPQEWADVQPEWPAPTDDVDVRFQAGAIFGFDLVDRRGDASRFDLMASGSLEWIDVPAGRHAVFSHIGPHTGLHELWDTIYRNWLPATGYPLRNTPPFEHYVSRPPETPADRCQTDLYLPLM